MDAVRERQGPTAVGTAARGGSARGVARRLVALAPYFESLSTDELLDILSAVSAVREFIEEEHPRDHGRFTFKDGGAASADLPDATPRNPRESYLKDEVGRRIEEFSKNDKPHADWLAAVHAGRFYDQAPGRSPYKGKAGYCTYNVGKAVMEGDGLPDGWAVAVGLWAQGSGHTWLVDAEGRASDPTGDALSVKYGAAYESEPRLGFTVPVEFAKRFMTPTSEPRERAETGSKWKFDYGKAGETWVREHIGEAAGSRQSRYSEDQPRDHGKFASTEGGSDLAASTAAVVAELEAKHPLIRFDKSLTTLPANIVVPALRSLDRMVGLFGVAPEVVTVKGFNDPDTLASTSSDGKRLALADWLKDPADAEHLRAKSESFLVPGTASSMEAFGESLVVHEFAHVLDAALSRADRVSPDPKLRALRLDALRALVDDPPSQYAAFDPNFDAIYEDRPRPFAAKELFAEGFTAAYSQWSEQWSEKSADAVLAVRAYVEAATSTKEYRDRVKGWRQARHPGHDDQSVHGNWAHGRQVRDFNPDQPRGEHGRWSKEGGGDDAGMALIPAVKLQYGGHDVERYTHTTAADIADQTALNPLRRVFESTRLGHWDTDTWKGDLPKNLSPENTAAFVRGMAKMAARFPTTMAGVVSAQAVWADGTTVAAVAEGTRVQLMDMEAASSAAALVALQRDMDGRPWSVLSSYEEVAIHEFGHLVLDHYRSPDNDPSSQPFRDWMREREDKSPAAQEAAALIASSQDRPFTSEEADRWGMAVMRKGVDATKDAPSEYAARGWGMQGEETFAECFAESMTKPRREWSGMTAEVFDKFIEPMAKMDADDYAHKLARIEHDVAMGWRQSRYPGQPRDDDGQFAGGAGSSLNDMMDSTGLGVDDSVNKLPAEAHAGLVSAISRVDAVFPGAFARNRHGDGVSLFARSQSEMDSRFGPGTAGATSRDGRTVMLSNRVGTVPSMYDPNGVHEFTVGGDTAEGVLTHELAHAVLDAAGGWALNGEPWSAYTLALSLPPVSPYAELDTGNGHERAAELLTAGLFGQPNEDAAKFLATVVGSYRSPRGRQPRYPGQPRDGQGQFASGSESFFGDYSAWDGGTVALADRAEKALARSLPNAKFHLAAEVYNRGTDSYNTEYPSPYALTAIVSQSAEFAAQFPRAADGMRFFIIRDLAPGRSAESVPGEVTIDTRFAYDTADEVRLNIRADEEGWHPKGSADNPEKALAFTVAHEFGHQLEYRYPAEVAAAVTEVKLAFMRADARSETYPDIKQVTGEMVHPVVPDISRLVTLGDVLTSRPASVYGIQDDTELWGELVGGVAVGCKGPEFDIARAALDRISVKDHEYWAQAQALAGRTARYSPDQPRDDDGRFGSGGGGPETIVIHLGGDLPKPMAQLDAENAIGELGVSADLAGMDNQRATAQVVAATTKFHDKFPGVTSRMSGIYNLEQEAFPEDKGPDVIAFAEPNGAVVMTDAWNGAGNVVALERKLAGSVLSGYSAPGGDTFESVLTHEFGHVLAYDSAEVANLQSDIAEGIGTPFGFRSDRISSYAHANMREAFAESYMNLVHQPERRWPEPVTAYLADRLDAISRADGGSGFGGQDHFDRWMNSGGLDRLPKTAYAQGDEIKRNAKAEAEAWIPDHLDFMREHAPTWAKAHAAEYTPAATTGRAARYSPDQPRDEFGRWSPDGGSIGIGISRVQDDIPKAHTYAEMLAQHDNPIVAASESALRGDLQSVVGVGVVGEQLAVGSYEGGGEASMRVLLDPARTTRQDLDITGAYLVRRNMQDSVIVAVTGKAMATMGVKPNGFSYSVTGISKDRMADVFRDIQEVSPNACVVPDSGDVRLHVYNEMDTPDNQVAFANLAKLYGGRLAVEPSHIRWYFHDAEARQAANWLDGPADAITDADAVADLYRGDGRVDAIPPSRASRGSAGAQGRGDGGPQRWRGGGGGPDREGQAPGGVGRYSADQPRDDNGRFGSKGESLSGEPTVRVGKVEVAYIPGPKPGEVDISEVVDAAKLNPAYAIRATSGRGVRATADIAERIGYDQPPTVVSRQQLDDAIAAGATELFRGIQGLGAGKYSDALREGTAYYGSGMFGSGIYSAMAEPDRPGRAEAVAKNFATMGTGGTVVRMALIPQAKAITADEAKDRMLAEARGMRKDEEFRVKFGDMANWAMLHGYDAIQVIAANGPVFYSGGAPSTVNVLNRTALLIQDEDIKP